MEKTKETLYDDTWDQEINTQVYLWPFLQILRILLEIFGLLLALDTHQHSLGGIATVTEITSPK